MPRQDYIISIIMEEERAVFAKNGEESSLAYKKGRNVVQEFPKGNVSQRLALPLKNNNGNTGLQI